MKRLIYTLILCFPLLVQAQQVTLNNTEWSGNGRQLRISYDIQPDRHKSLCSYSTTVTPVLCGENDTLRFEPVTYRGRTNAKKQRRAAYFNHEEFDENYRDIKDNTPISRQEVLDVADYPWLKDSKGLSLCAEVTTEDCTCKVGDGMDCQQLGERPADFVPAMAPVVPPVCVAEKLQPHHPILEPYSDYRPYDKTRILRKEEGALYVYFPLDKIDLRYDFRGNSSVLDTIISISRQIAQDTNSIVRRIQIIGLASVEGPLEHNNWLAGKRALALQKYIQDRVSLPDTLFEIVGGGEAWTEFRDQMNDIRLAGGSGELSLAEVEDVLRIIDTETDLNRREQQLKALNNRTTYAKLKPIILADQRNSGYLRFYWDRVPDEAAAVINRASELVGQERYEEAVVMLDAVKDDPRSFNTLGSALYMLGNYVDGLDYIRRAAEAGNAQAAENLKQLENRLNENF
ncbi:MAG: hypothetical protein IJR64_01840 [Bacteroidales bacterium]|nr:hypothetical protein [Bacteroidales bacterium]